MVNYFALWIYHYKNRSDHILQHDQGGVDTLDQMVDTYTCRCQTDCLVTWYNLSDIATLDLHSIFTAQHFKLTWLITHV